MAFTRYEVEKMKSTLKQFVRNMKKIGIHPQVRIDQKHLDVIIDLDEIVSVVRNMVTSNVNPVTQRFLKVNVKRDGQLMVVEVYKVERGAS